MIHLHLTANALQQNELEAGETADKITPGIYFNTWFVDVFRVGSHAEFYTGFVHSKSYMCILVRGNSLAENYNLFQETFIRLLKHLRVPKDNIIKEVKAMLDCCLLESKGMEFSVPSGKIVEMAKDLLASKEFQSGSGFVETLNTALLTTDISDFFKAQTNKPKEAIQAHFRKTS